MTGFKGRSVVGFWFWGAIIGGSRGLVLVLVGGGWGVRIRGSG